MKAGGPRGWPARWWRRSPSSRQAGALGIARDIAKREERVRLVEDNRGEAVLPEMVDPARLV